MEKENIRLGLSENRFQFYLLVLVNAFVGGMVGMERSILPALAEEEFALAAKTAILSFIVVFGITKAISNYYAGTLVGKFGRKKILIAGWLFGLPVPLLLIYAPDWSWVIAANVLLGINQGLAWSATVIMKIDLVGEKKRGLAMGINESAGYVAVALMSFATGYIAGEYGVRPYPFLIGLGMAIIGLLVTIFFVRDTTSHVRHETSFSVMPRLKNIFKETTRLNKNLSSVTQAGLINNLNDGMVWGLFPILLTAKGFSLGQIGLITAVYPGVWGLGQLITGRISDVFCKKDLMFVGMLMQSFALVGMILSNSYVSFIALSALLGWGTAMVYPTFLASIAENVHPLDRAGSIGVFRLWRDLGYAFGALLTGLLADLFNINYAIFLVGILTFMSALIIKFRMSCMNPQALKVWEWLMNKQHATHESN
jgi:MFS family permease